MLVIEEILASRGIRPRPCFGGPSRSDRLQQFPAPARVELRGPYRDEAYCRLTMPCQDDFIARLGASHQLRQLTLRIGHRNPHSGPLSESKSNVAADMDHSMVHVKRLHLKLRLSGMDPDSRWTSIDRGLTPASLPTKEIAFSRLTGAPGSNHPHALNDYARLCVSIVSIISSPRLGVPVTHRA